MNKEKLIKLGYKENGNWFVKNFKRCELVVFKDVSKNGKITAFVKPLNIVSSQLHVDAIKDAYNLLEADLAALA